MHNELTALSSSGIVIAVVIEWLKRRSWFPWITASSETVNRWVAAGLAVLASLGVHVEFQAEVGVLTISGLALATLSEIIRDTFITWVSAKGYYKLLIRS